MLVEAGNRGNILNYTVWSPGTSGSEPGFSVNGAALENYRVIDTGPQGSKIAVWEARPDSSGNADGGWNTNTFPIDNTKMYRFSVWIRRTVQGNGTAYLGLNGYGSSDGVLNRSNASNNTNPYFYTSSAPSPTTGEWSLWVGHVWPKGSGSGGQHPDSGRYTVENGHIGSISQDFVWGEETTSVRHRSYLYYATDASTRQQFCYPRVDLCDGSEPTIEDLLSGIDERWEYANFPSTLSIKSNSSQKVRYIRDWLNGSTANTNSHWVEIQAFDHSGTNVALGKSATSPLLTDGNTSSNPYYSAGEGLRSVQVDLGGIYNIDHIKVWHYYSDGRTYYDTKTEISGDGITWLPIFDSFVDGTYKETLAGITHQVIKDEPTGGHRLGVHCPGVSEVGISRGLVAWYPLIGDTKDYAGTNHATNNGAVATAEGYEFGGSASLSANTAIPTTGTQEWTVSALVRLDQNTTGTQYLLNFNMGIRLVHTSANNKMLLYLNSGVNDSYAYGGVLPLGEWVHLTAVVNETTLDARLYLNEQVYGTADNWSPTRTPSGIPSTTVIGGGTYGAFRDVRIHNVALTPEEVAIQAKLALNPETKTAMTQSCLYTKGQIKEVIA